MTSKEEYPKEIITYEKIAENSEDTEKVITVVKNEYEENAVIAAINYMDAFNNYDVHECDKNLHFPHVVVIMNGNSISTEKTPFHSERYFKVISKASEWHNTCWDSRRVLHSGKHKVHLDLQFTRYKYDGNKIATSPAIWIMTHQNGQWGIKIRSIYL